MNNKPDEGSHYTEAMTHEHIPPQHDPLALRGYNPRSVSGPPNPDHRYGTVKQALSTVTADLAWLESQYETARLLLTSAAKLLVSNPSPDATDNFARAMATFHAMSTRTSAALRAVDTAMQNCLEGEAEQERRSRLYTKSIVDGSKRFVSTAPQKGQ